MQPLISSANIFPITIDQTQKLVDRTDFDRRLIPFSNIIYSTTIFHALWTNAIDGMRLTDENGIIIAVNKAFCDLVEMKEQELVGKLFTVTYPPTNEREQLLSSYKMIFATGMYQTIFELHPVIRSGKALEIETNSTCVDSDKGRKLLLTQFHDITEKRKTERILQESEAKYRGLFANSIQAMFECAVTGKIVNANRSFLRLLGYQSFDEIADLNLQKDVYVQEDAHSDLSVILETRSYIRNIEMQLKRKNGKIITVVENARALYDEAGKMIGIEGVFEDVTAEKSLEKKLHKSIRALEESKHKLTDLNTQKNKLLSILSHDLRSPFTSILGFCDILIKENETLSSAERVEFAQYIMQSAQDQLNTVTNLLDWTRIESGRINIDSKDIDLNRIVEKSIISLIGLAKKKEIHLLNRVPINTFTYGDSQLLLQLFTNLISNSLKFTPASGKISIELLKDENDQWTIAVKDTGVGIPESDMPKLFKIDEKYTRKGLSGERGTGLGLPVCQEIIQKHHGSISVKSEYGKGTTFFLQFPKVSVPTGKSILIVDDEQGIRTLHTKYLQRLLPEINIMQASDGEEAFDLAISLQPILIISDHDMPNVNGHELVKKLKEDSSTKSIPIIYATGYGSNVMHKSLKDLGVSVFLNKPISQEQFEKTLSGLGIK
jgi:PAS domain S-box-containing protein